MQSVLHWSGSSGKTSLQADDRFVVEAAAMLLGR
jgi:hypothetical protein